MRTQVAVVGAGPGGSVAALSLARAGVDVTVIEQADFPRFHIGESLTGVAGKLLRTLGFNDDMIQRSHPVKRGVSVWGPNGKNHFFVPVVDVTQNGTRQFASTWQVRRSDFDAMLLQAALDAGATVLTGSATSPIVLEDGSVGGVEVSTESGDVTVGSDVLVDATGQGCFLARAGVTSEKKRGNYSKQIAVFTHVTNADCRETGDDTVIVYKESRQWAWFIPIDAETVSVGVVVPARYFREKGESAEEFLTREFQELNPQLAVRLTEAQMVRQPQIISNYSYEIERFVGAGWLCVGDSHQFIDPVFSFGLHLAVHEGHRAATDIVKVLETGERSENMFDDFAAWATGGQDVVRDLVDAFWGEPLAFSYLAHQKHRDDMIDLFAGRFYGITEPSKGLRAMRAIAVKARAKQAQTNDLEAVLVS
jgi:1H-pyrrole-2-carbonyl-[peptidyl-carrier protein] brominase